MTEMTPETLKNAAPDNLKKLARLIRMGQPLRSIAASEAIDLCVAVWAADRARIEALEKAAQFKRNVIIRDTALVGRWVAVPEEDFNALRAALAAKEKP